MHPGHANTVTLDGECAEINVSRLKIIVCFERLAVLIKRYAS